MKRSKSKGTARAGIPGYSGKPLAGKLGIGEGSRVLVVEAPEDYQGWVSPLPHRVAFATRLAALVNLVHVFATSRAKLERWLERCRATLKADAVVWVSWPKKSSGVETDLTEDGIREIALTMGFVDVKVCAVTDVWSGLKLVVRKELR